MSPAAAKRSAQQFATGELAWLPTEEVKPMPGQPRLHFNAELMGRLQQSIAKIGQQQPATVVPWKDGSYRLRDGERRWRCCRALGRPLLALIVDARSPEEEFELATAANMNREGHSPLEKALAMKRLRDGPLKRSMTEVARTFGVTEATVASHLLVLDDLPPSVQELMDANKMGGRPRVLQLTAAVRLTALAAYPAEQYRIARKIVDENLPLNQAISLIDRSADKHKVTEGRGRERKPSDHARSVRRAVTRLNTALSAALKTHGLVADILDSMDDKRRAELGKDLQRAADLLTRFGGAAS